MTPEHSEASGDDLLIWGTYDIGKPRTRLLIDALENEYHVVGKIHSDLWKGVEDKSQIKGVYQKLCLFTRLVFIYPNLIIRYIFAAKHDYLFLPYLGLLDLLLIWPLARLRRATICIDVFISLYDTIVIDRKLLKKGGFAARTLYRFEWIALRLADKRLLDTQAHAHYIEALFQLKPCSNNVVWVGAENKLFFHLNRPKPIGETVSVLFYGQFIPLHGLEIIVEAAETLQKQANNTIEFVIVGNGQLEGYIDGLIEQKKLENIRRINWVPYEELNQLIAESDICLGVFAAHGKSLRVIPNKVFQIIAAKKPLITADTPAIRELDLDSDAIVLVSPGDPKGLAKAVIEFASRLHKGNLDIRGFPSVDITKLSSQIRIALG